MTAEWERIEALRVKASMEQAEGQRKAHRERIHAETLHDLMMEFGAWKVANMPNARGLAAQAVEAISAGRIRHLRIIY